MNKFFEIYGVIVNLAPCLVPRFCISATTSRATSSFFSPQRGAISMFPGVCEVNRSTATHGARFSK